MVWWGRLVFWFGTLFGFGCSLDCERVLNFRACNFSSIQPPASIFVQVHRICWRSPYLFHRVSPPAYLRTRAGCTSKSQVWIEVPEHVVEKASARVCVVVHGDGLIRVYGRYTAVTCRAPHGWAKKSPRPPFPPVQCWGGTQILVLCTSAFAPASLPTLKTGGRGGGTSCRVSRAITGFYFARPGVAMFAKRGFYFARAHPLRRGSGVIWHLGPERKSWAK